MADITIHGPEQVVAQRLQHKAELTGETLEDTIKKVLREAVDEPQPPKLTVEERRKMFEEFCGDWTKEEADEFDRAIIELGLEDIDPELWE